MRAISSQHPSVVFGGAGGDAMEKLCEEQFDNWVQRAAVTGLWDVLKNYGYFRQKFHAMLTAIHGKKPDAVVLVD
jgi:lipid-A-disaccharide synthase